MLKVAFSGPSSVQFSVPVQQFSVKRSLTPCFLAFSHLGGKSTLRGRNAFEIRTEINCLERWEFFSFSFCYKIPANFRSTSDSCLTVLTP